jgi:hypothetical protein
MKSSLNQEKLEEIKDPAPGREEYYDKSKGEITPLNQVGIVDPALATQQQVAQQIPQAVQQPVQQNQITPSLINPNVLGGFDPQKLTGVPNPTQSFDNTMPQGSALAKKKM